MTAAARMVLDATCGPRMMWFDKADERALFVDNRTEEHTVSDRGRSRVISVRPDVVASFEALPFSDSTFPLVVFDPPHLGQRSRNGTFAKTFGVLGGADSDWRSMLRHGFAECFRVLCPLGTLVFKWSERDIPVRDVLALTDRRPLFGQRCGAKARTHWIVFMKEPGA